MASQSGGSGLRELFASLEAEGHDGPQDAAGRQDTPSSSKRPEQTGTELKTPSRAYQSTADPLLPPNAWARGGPALRRPGAKPAPPRQVKSPPEGSIKKISLPDDGVCFFKKYHEQSIKITLSGDGRPAVRDDEVLNALAERDVDIRSVRSVWKGSNMRYLNVTFESPEEAKKAATLDEFKIREAKVSVAGRETATEVKVHWVPAWIGDAFVTKCLQDYGELLSYRSETKTIGGVLVFTGTKIARIKTTPESAAAIPVAFEIAGPIAARLLVTVRGRPPLCLQCFEIGHKQRSCPDKRPPPPEIQEDMDKKEDDDKDNDQPNECDKDKVSGDETEESDEDDEDDMETVPEEEGHHKGTQGAAQLPTPPPPIQDVTGSPDFLEESPLVIDIPKSHQDGTQDAAQTSPPPPPPQTPQTNTEDTPAVQESPRSSETTIDLATPESVPEIHLETKQATPAPTPTPPLRVEVEHAPWNTTPATPSPTDSETFIPPYLKPGPDRQRSSSRGRTRQATDQTPYSRPEQDRRRTRRDFRQTEAYQEAASKAEMSMSRFMHTRPTTLEDAIKKAEDAAKSKTRQTNDLPPKETTRSRPPTRTIDNTNQDDRDRPWNKPDWPRDDWNPTKGNNCNIWDSILYPELDDRNTTKSKIQRHIEYADRKKLIWKTTEDHYIRSLKFKQPERSRTILDMVHYEETCPEKNATEENRLRYLEQRLRQAQRWTQMGMKWQNDLFFFDKATIAAFEEDPRGE